MINQDTDVIIAINNLGLHVIDPTNVVSIHTQLGHPYRVFIPGHPPWTEVRGAVLGLRQAQPGEQRRLPALSLHSVLSH